MVAELDDIEADEVMWWDVSMVAELDDIEADEVMWWDARQQFENVAFVLMTLGYIHML